MSKRVCQSCGKGIMRGHNVSHSKKRTKKVSKPNLQKVKIPGKGKMLLCTRCIRKLKKEAAAKVGREPGA